MRYRLSTIIAIMLFQISTIGQAVSETNGALTGTLVESATLTPLEFANVILFNQTDSSQVKGTVSDRNGKFEITNIPTGNYYLKLSYIGFESEIIDNVEIIEARTLDLETIKIAPKTFRTDAVEVVENRSPISFEIDKKVIKVSEELTAISGNAVDILENVPSVTVDIEGNVSLRGSGSFTVLVDGRPTIMDANEVLQQIPASSIENIEIITNPSAKHDPEGTAGIINLVMKKNKNLGTSGIAELNGGLRNKYGGQLLGDYNTEAYNVTLGLDYNNRNYYRNETEINQTTYQGNTSFFDSYGRADRGRNYLGVRGEFGFDLSEMDYLMFGARYRERSHQSDSYLNYSEWTSGNSTKQFFTSNAFRKREGDNISAYLTYDHKFQSKGHILKAEIQYERGNGDEITVNELVDQFDFISSGRRSFEKGPEDEFETQIEYTLPLGKDTKFEAGYENEFEYSNEITGISDLNTSTQQYQTLPEFDRDVVYEVSEHSLFSLFGSEWEDLGYQVGIRAEYTGRKILLKDKNQNFEIDRFDFFPSMHISYKFNNEHQTMASYTRRIDRPGGWELEPFETWVDAYNVRVGNPALIPEFIDSYELSYQAVIGETVFSVENYYRVNHNKIERVRSVYDDNITLQSMENVGTDYSYGAELMLNFDPIKDWNINLMGNIYNYKIEGVIFDQPFSRESLTWSTRFNNRLKLWDSAQLQFNAMYNSPRVYSQGKRKGYFHTNIAVRQDFFEKSLVATLQIRDVFGTSEYEYTSESADYYNFSNVLNESPIVMLSLKFLFNKKDQGRDRGNGGDGQEGGDDF
ncbi:MAG: TonB-dependent receptor [Melioribacteraceae bacterium]|nr:TonB-dependent receptor [Melioribacteraceae bacterium]MCF8263780.1 TonB-dependent receptor [Melioribacteraceae bacterium]MCF8430787.1 TonB-dependent receptor [Melioribacteraceae bacterium]